MADDELVQVDLSVNIVLGGGGPAGIDGREEERTGGRRVRAGVGHADHGQGPGRKRGGWLFHTHAGNEGCGKCRALPIMCPAFSNYTHSPSGSAWAFTCARRNRYVPYPQYNMFFK